MPGVTLREVLLLLGYALIEFWLGKTRKTRAASVIEFAAILAVTMIVTMGAIWKRGKDE